MASTEAAASMADVVQKIAATPCESGQASEQLQAHGRQLEEAIPHAHADAS